MHATFLNHITYDVTAFIYATRTCRNTKDIQCTVKGFSSQIL